MADGPPLRDIGCFALVARHLSFSKAAAELGMSQPAVSQAIARLERTLGLRLFVRTSREVHLSDAGHALLPQAEAVLEQAAAFTSEATRLAVPAPPGIRLAYAPLVGGFAARLARRLSTRKPSVDVELRPAGWQSATHELSHALSSIALMSTPFPSGYATAARFHVALTHLAVPASDRLASAARVSLAQVSRILAPRGLTPYATHPTAGPSTTHSTAGRPATRSTAGPGGGHRAGGRFAAQPAAGPYAGHGPAETVDDLSSAVDLVAAGRGALPVPQLLVDTVRRSDIRFVPLSDPALRLTFGLVWPATHSSEDVMALVQTAQELLRR